MLTIFRIYKESRSISTEPTESVKAKKDRSKSPRNRTPKKNGASLLSTIEVVKIFVKYKLFSSS